MTGFARVRKPVSGGELSVTIKSVNHRGLDLHFHLASEFDAVEAAMRAAVKSRVARGHLQITLNLTRTTAADGGYLNRDLLAAYLQAFEQARKEFHLKGEPDLNAALRVPAMFRAEPAALELSEDLERAIVEATGETCEALNAFREREGAAIVAEMRERCEAISERADGMEKIRAKATAAFHKRLKQRLGELLKGAGVDPHRLAQEAAILADRSDISEELVRLKTHATQLHVLLDSSGEVGKKLDFLLQEMNRETNTVLSKTGGAGDIGLTITGLALETKAEVDKIREQSLNLE
ncbi:MAG: YicC family protein [Bryobacterales bacterium]|nr:YicC family protein [Bryobacterales bacterium]